MSEKVTDTAERPSFQYRRYATNGSYTIASSGNGYQACNYKRTVGMPTPQYHKLVREHRLIPYTPFTQFERTTLDSMAYDVGDFTWPTSGTHDVFVPSSACVSSTTDDPNVAESALSAVANQQDVDYFVQVAASKIYSKSWDALTFLAEFHRTVRMFKGAVGKLISIIRGKPPGTPWNLWLEGRYGWRILLYDMKDIQKACNGLNGMRTRWVERAGSSNTWTEHASGSVNAGTFWKDWTRTKTWTVGLRGSIAADVSIPDASFNPLTTTWELITFSFVVDWFINVGQALNALSFLALQTNYTAAGGVQVRLVQQYKWVGRNGSKKIVGPTQYDRLQTCVYVSRSPTSVSKLPQVRLRLDDLKILDLLALLSQALTRR